MVNLAAFAVLLGLTLPQTEALVATHVSDTDITTLVSAAPESSVADDSIRLVDAGGYNVGIGIVQRPATDRASAIQHHGLTEVYRVIAGAGTLVTGGTLINSRELAADSQTVKVLTGPSDVGQGIDGGVARRIATGDMVIIPAGVPHGFTEIEEDIAYLVVRVDPQQLLQIK
jgi:mannose-6-phosphate isomerase-like protein (cupin superfamily)